MVTFTIKYFIIQHMKKEGESHLPAPPVGCSCLDDGPISIAPPKTSMITNQYICIFESPSPPHLFQEFIFHIQVFHILHRHTMKLLLGIKSFLPRRPIVEFGSKNWFAAGSPFGSENRFAAGCQFGSETCFATGATISAAKTSSLQPTCFAAANATSL